MEVGKRYKFFHFCTQNDNVIQNCILLSIFTDSMFSPHCCFYRRTVVGYDSNNVKGALSWNSSQPPSRRRN